MFSCPPFRFVDTIDINQVCDSIHTVLNSIVYWVLNGYRIVCVVKNCSQFLQLILGLQPEIVYPGHGPVIESPQTQISYYINHRNKREEQIMNALTSSPDFLTPLEVVKLVYTVSTKHQTFREYAFLFYITVNPVLDPQTNQHSIFVH